MTHEQRVGFSQRIQIEWLEYTANLALAGSSRDETDAALGERLREALSIGNDPKRGNRDKAITILTKVWVTVPQELRTLREEGLELLQRSDTGDRMVVHWCMCMAAYPFFGAVAEVAGRLLGLQGSVGAAQVQRRLRERFGERETVARAARRILRMFIDWGVLLEAGEKGIYRGANKLDVGGSPLSVWAIQAILAAQGGKPGPVSCLLNGPRLFPFNITLPPMTELEACDALEIIFHGLDHEVLVGLA